MRVLARCVFIAVLLIAGAAHAAAPTIAVMPLRDLAGGRANVGAALRETLTVDFRGASGIKVVEREAIDRVMREQSIDSARGLEGVTGVRLGTLLGASHLVTGAYQRQGHTLRVTVRVIAVESGQVVGSAKVDGDLERMLELEDRVGHALLASVGWKAPATIAMKARPRPRLTAHSIELFGDAQLEPDVEKKKKLLHEAVKETPQFSYAVDELAALEGRLSGYEQQQAAQLGAEERAALAIATDEHKAASVRTAKIAGLLPAMKAQRRYRALLAACDALAHAPAESRDEIVYQRFIALQGLRRVDDAMAAGEKLLASGATSPHFAEVETNMRKLADTKRTMATRRADYDKDLAEKRNDLGGHPPAGGDKLVDWDWAPCIAARWNRQYNQLMIDGCRPFAAKYADAKSGPPAEHAKAARLFVILALGELGRLEEARRELAEFRKRYPEGDDELDQKLAEWSTD